MRRRLIAIGILIALALLLLFSPYSPLERTPENPTTPVRPDPPGEVSDLPSVPTPAPEAAVVEDTSAGGTISIPPFRFLVLDLVTGEPIEGARVETDPDPGDEPYRLKVDPAPTGADGRTSFVIDHVGIGCANIRAGKPGYQMVRELVNRDGLSEIRLIAGAPVTGRVVLFDTGRAVQDAVVRAFTHGQTREVCRPAMTDADGEFVLDAVPPGEMIYFVADVSGFAPTLEFVAIPKAGGRVDFTVGGRGTLEGRVLDPAGDPAPGIEVWVMRPHVPLPPRSPGGHWTGGDDFERLIRFLYPRQITDEAGGFRFVGVRLSTEQIAVAKLSEFAEAVSEPFTFAADGEELIRDIRIPEPATAVLTVWNAAEEVVPGVQIDFRSERVWFDARNAGTPLKDGSVRVAGIAPGRWELRAFIPGTDAVEKVVDLAPGENAGIEFRAPAGLDLSGVVVDPDGNPVAFATVTSRSPPWISGDTDRQGRFRLTGLSEGSVDVEVRSNWFDPATTHRPLVPKRVEGVRPGGEPIRVVLPWGGFVTGRIPEGEPGDDLRLQIFSRKVSSHGSHRLSADGTFRITAPEPGLPFLLKIICGGRPPRYLERGPLREGEDLSLGDITFEQGRRLAGSIVDPENNAVEGAKIKLIERWLDISAVSDSTGRFRFDGMPDRPIWANVSAKGFPDHLVIFDPPGEGPGPVVRLTRGGRLKADVRTSAGKPLTKGTYSIKWLVTHPLDAELDDLGYYFSFRNGRFEQSLEPGRYRVRVSDEEYEEKWEGEIAISEGMVVEQRVDLMPD